ncbi:phage tail protein [Cohnella thailandensis]|nr:tail fiber protein [Cohnella thailandensis]MBP1977892.1 microcystin-dependent protein [Cohnella thailandensis]
MPDPYVGEIRVFAHGAVPAGWLPCNGQQLDVQTHYALFTILGTQFGGDGIKTFALPDLQGRVPLCPSPSIAPGSAGGSEEHALTIAEMPGHAHRLFAGTDTATVLPDEAAWGFSSSVSYRSESNTTMSRHALAVAGGNQAHSNMQPYLSLNYCVCERGIYPQAEGGFSDDPFVGEIRLFAGTFAPYGWAFCDGQSMNIRDYMALASVIYVTYGGDGQTTFKLPDLRGYAPMNWGAGEGLTPRIIGVTGGEPAIALTEEQIPEHTHAPNAQTSSNTANPQGAVWAAAATAKEGDGGSAVRPMTERVPMNAQSIQPSGGGEPHNNRQPYVAIPFIISLGGIFPARP